MLVQDLEKNIYALGGRKVEYTELMENEEKYWYCRLPCYKSDNEFTEVLLKELTPAEFFNFITDDETPKEWIYLFYHIPVLDKTASEIQREVEIKDNRFKEILICCMTDDGENILHMDGFYPKYLKQDRINQIANNVFNQKLQCKKIEKNIYTLDGKKLEYSELSNNIEKYIRYYRPWSYSLYSKNSLNRLRNMTEYELIYHLTNADFLTTYTYQFYHIPYKEKYRQKIDRHNLEYHFKFYGFEKSFIDVKEILVVTGTHDNKDLEFFKIFFPFDMIEEKQKEIKNFILNGKLENNVTIFKIK